MNKISLKEKKMICGGGKCFSYIFNKNALNPKAFKSINKNTYKKINYGIHNTGMAVIATATTTLNFVDTFFEASENESSEAYQSHENNNFKSPKRRLFADAIRPTLRYTPYPHTSTVVFGLPWHY